MRDRPVKAMKEREKLEDERYRGKQYESGRQANTAKDLARERKVNKATIAAKHSKCYSFKR